MGRSMRRIFKQRSSIPYQLNIFNLSTVIFAVLLYFKGREVSTEQVSKDLNENCLHCVCQAMSGCNHSIGCITTNDTMYCGPYQISYKFWLDSGKLGNTNPSTLHEDFIDCANSERCATKAIQQYHVVYYKDCNGDTLKNCVDFFRTHLAGPKLCNKTELENRSRWLKFLECYLNLANSTEDALRSFRSYGSN